MENLAVVLKLICHLHEWGCKLVLSQVAAESFNFTVTVYGLPQGGVV